MKTITKALLPLALFICTAGAAVAQQAQDCDQLRDSIDQVEKLDISSMSHSVQQLYKESLLKLYVQFDQCLDRDIANMVELEKAVTNTSASPAVEDKLHSFKKEKADVAAKIIAMRTALNLPELPAARGDSVATTESPVTRDSEPKTRNGNRTDIRSPLNATKTTSNNAPPSPAIDCTPANPYADAPRILQDIVGKAALDVINHSTEPERIKRPAMQMMLYAIFDSASKTSSDAVRALTAYNYLSETARTDKQLGGAANSNGAVSAIEKPGFASLLGFAIENGAINKKVNGTNLTLSTSLYSLYAINKPKTAETYAKAGVLNRIGLSSTFDITNQDNGLANATRNNLVEWSVKARLYGDRSTRSARFQRFWDREVRPAISERLQAIGGSIEGLSEKIDDFDDWEGNTIDPLTDLVRSAMECPAFKDATTPEAKQQVLTNIVLSYLKTNVVDSVQNGSHKLSPEVVALIESDYLPRLRNSLDQLVLADKKLQDAITDLNKGPLATFAYTNHRVATGSDYSETKFLFEQDKSSFAPLKLTGNFGLSFYNRPNASLNQRRLRDIAAALSFEGSSDSPFTESGNQSKITYSFVGRYEHLFENENRAARTPDIRVLQFVTEIPFIKGLSLPLSLSYANATEEERKQHWRFNFGMHLDTDKLLDLLKAASSQ